MRQYLALVERVLQTGVLTNNRTQTAAYTTFGGQLELDLQDGFPLLTTKYVFFKAVLVELLWFIKGDTNIKYLVDHDVFIWNEWAYVNYQKSPAHVSLTLAEFGSKIRHDPDFARQFGDLGPVYGKQWRDYCGVDQLKNVIQELQVNPQSRRLLVCAWNPVEVAQMALPPCHCLFQFNVINGQLSLHLYQRSADLFLGVPFNIASYACLLLIVAQITGFKPGKFVHSFGNLHIYENHVKQCKLQLTREPYPLCKLIIDPAVKSIDALKVSDFQLVNYVHHPKLKGVVAV